MKAAMIVLMIATFVAIIVLDIFAAANSTRGDTFSEIFLWTSRHSLLFAALWGTVFGHLLWYGASWRPQGLITVGILSLTALLWLGFDLHYWINNANIANTGAIAYLRSHPIITFAMHLVVGRYFWPQ